MELVATDFSRTCGTQLERNHFGPCRGIKRDRYTANSHISLDSVSQQNTSSLSFPCSLRSGRVSASQQSPMNAKEANSLTKYATRYAAWSSYPKTYRLYKRARFELPNSADVNNLAHIPEHLQRTIAHLRGVAGYLFVGQSNWTRVNDVENTENYIKYSPYYTDGIYTYRHVLILGSEIRERVNEKSRTKMPPQAVLKNFISEGGGKGGGTDRCYSWGLCGPYNLYREQASYDENNNVENVLCNYNDGDNIYNKRRSVNCDSEGNPDMILYGDYSNNNLHRLLTEDEIINQLGIRLSKGWEHYLVFNHRFKVLLLRRLNTSNNKCE